MATQAQLLMQDQNLNLLYNGATPLEKTNVGKADKKRVGGRKALNDISNSRKSSVVHTTKKDNPTNVISIDKDPNVARAKFSKVPEKGKIGGRKALTDLTNSVKPSSLKEPKGGRKLNTSEEENVHSSVVEERFLHNHQECIKAQRKGVDMDYFLKLVGLNNDMPPQLSNKRALQLSLKKHEDNMKDIEMEEIPDQILELLPGYSSPACKSPKSLKPDYVNWEDDIFSDMKVTPGTPPPLISSLPADSPPYDQKTSMRKCLEMNYDISLARKVGAEFIGTFMVIFAAAAGPIVNRKYDGVETLIGNAACSGLAVTIVVLSIGHISGAHLNPSVTIAFAALRHFPLMQVPAYFAAQLSGSICASFALKGIFHPIMSGGVTVPSISTGRAFALEFVVTFYLMFVITAVATDTRAVGELAGIAIGATVLLDILVAGPSTGASMNPARTLGPAIVTGNYKSIWIYFTAPTLGALAGATMYTLVKLPAKDDEGDPPPPRPRSFRR